MDVYVLDKNLRTVGMIDDYRSLIWAKRYRENGDAELYVSASTEALQMLKIGYYLIRLDDDMVIRIKRIELDTSAEEGNYLIVSGTDCKDLLDQRIIWTTQVCDGNVEDFARSLVNICIISPDNTDREMKNAENAQLLYLGTKANLPETATEQVSYKNLGEKIREYCANYGWGSRVVLTDNHLSFELYNGADRTSTVVFSDEFENLSATKYSDDWTNLGNVALVGGEGKGALREKVTAGEGSGTDRYEIFVDADDVSKAVTYKEMREQYPISGGGSIQPSGDAYVYVYTQLDIPVYTDDQLADLQTKYPTGSLVTVDSKRFWRVPNAIIADLENDQPAQDETVTLRDIVYDQYLMQRGYDALSEYGAVKSFEGSIDPNTTFRYKEDYFLGDIVTVENSFGISVSARIVEVTEVWDDSGYNIEPIFEYIGGQ